MNPRLADFLGQTGEELANGLINKWPRQWVVERGNRAAKACIDRVGEGRPRAIGRKINRRIATNCGRCALSIERELHVARRRALRLLRRCAVGAFDWPYPNICPNKEGASIPPYFFSACHRLLQ